MHASFVMTVLGADRPGLVEALAGLVAGHGGNWLESRMCHLAGQFAGILRVQVPAPRQEALRQALQELSTQGLTILIQTGREAGELPAHRLVLLELVGRDRPGIVNQVARVLAAREVNVEELHTETASAPMSGDILFHARARLLLPPACSAEALREDLERIARDLMVDLNLAPV